MIDSDAVASGALIGRGHRAVSAYETISGTHLHVVIRKFLATDLSGTMAWVVVVAVIDHLRLSESCRNKHSDENGAA